MSWINVKAVADPRGYELSGTAVRCPAHPPARSYMAGSISNFDAELKVVWTHAAELSPSAPSAPGCFVCREVSRPRRSGYRASGSGLSWKRTTSGLDKVLPGAPGLGGVMPSMGI